MKARVLGLSLTKLFQPEKYIIHLIAAKKKMTGLFLHLDQYFFLVPDYLPVIKMNIPRPFF